MLDRTGALLKKVITFEDVFLLNNFECSSADLHVIADNKLVSFGVSHSQTSLVRAANWLATSSSVGQLDLFHLAGVVNTGTGHSTQDFLSSTIPGANHALQAINLRQSPTQFVLENLGIIKTMTIFKEEYLAVLCRTDIIFRVVVLRMSELEALVRRNLRRSGNPKTLWQDQSKIGYEGQSDDEQDHSSATHNMIDVAQLAKSHRGTRLRDVRNIYWLGHTFLAVYGTLIELLDGDLKVLRVWTLDADVACLKELSASLKCEVWFP